MTKPSPSVIVGAPVYGHVPGLSMISNVRFIGVGIASGLVQHFSPTYGTYIDHGRNAIVHKLLATPTATHLFFIDQDMVVPETIIADLLARDVEIVAGLYFQKVWPHPVVAFDLNPFRMHTSYLHDSLTRVDGVGLGATLIHRSVFEKIVDSYPTDPPGADGTTNTLWFKTSEDSGEDVWFAKRCWNLDIPIHLDTTVICGHVGDITVGVAQHEQARRIEQEDRNRARDISNFNGQLTGKEVHH